MMNLEVWEHELEYYYDDTIYITYYSDTGKAYIDIGKDVEPEFSGKDISEIETSFRMAENENDFSGFASGITALTEKIANPDDGQICCDWDCCDCGSAFRCWRNVNKKAQKAEPICIKFIIVLRFVIWYTVIRKSRFRMAVPEKL